ncbi:PA0069 family radical SAM protein [Rhodovulum sp. DZ06]|uniref:PA0069 family radical SAM protein n=1 Tax=Rhodovulum sp. DZ06 TaxID=3425126 RepID=UPI003D349CB8
MGDLFGMDDAARVAPGLRRGRGAVSNRVGRYERETRAPVDDGWEGDEDDAPPPLRTRLIPDASRSVIARNASPDLPFDRSINPYRGCEHGCVYCFARPTHAHLGMSPGLDFETRILVKRGAPRLLEGELRRRGYAVAPIAMGANTDPYQPAEREERVTRGILEVLQAHRHPLSIVTKGALVTRDLDIFGEMGRAGLAQVAVSLTSLDNRLSRSVEPRAASPQARLRAIAALSRAGVPVGVMLAPVIPAVTDHEIERLLEAAARAGAKWAGWIGLRLPAEVEGIFREWLEAEMPDRAARVMGRVAELHGGKVYDGAFGRRMTGQGVWSALLRRRVETARKRLGLASRPPELRRDLFRVPPRPGDQLDLF